VVVCNLRGKKVLANKDDRIDADHLSEQLRLGGLKAVFHDVPGMLTLKELFATKQPRVPPREGAPVMRLIACRAGADSAGAARRCVAKECRRL